MAFELIWSSDDVDHDTVSLNGISAVETIHDLSNKTFNNYSRLIMQFSKSTDTAPNHLYVDIHIKMKSGKSYPPKLQTYIVCYGIKGLQSDVPSTVYDALWGVDNGVVTFNEPIDMGNKKITGVADGTTYSDVVNVKQLNDAVNQIKRLLKYNYSTRGLKLNNEKIIKFPYFYSYPFQRSSIVSDIIILEEGYYHIIYTDYYKNGGDFKIYHGWDKVLFDTNLNSKSNWTPFTINAVIRIKFPDGRNSAHISMKSDDKDLIFDGINNSSFFIEYLFD